MKLVDCCSSPLEDRCTTAWNRSFHYNLVTYVLATLQWFRQYFSITIFVQAFRDEVTSQRIPCLLRVQTGRIPSPTVCQERRAGIMAFLKRWHVARVQAAIALV